jgi:hypothetical protein
MKKPILPKFFDEIMIGYGVQDISSSKYYLNHQPDCVNFSLRDTIID